MSSPIPFPEHPPLIALVDRANRALQSDMVRQAHLRGYPQVKQAHNAVFSTLGGGGARASEMAERAGITRQSMGEIIRDMVELGILEMQTDPADRRAKLVTYTPAGIELTTSGYQHILDQEERFAEALGSGDYELVRAGLERIVEMLTTSDQW
jgi:DNA-binding MarR family transcriptional regulator